MNKVERKAYAKINLGLDVVRKREDGYHEVKMVMQNVDLYDELVMEKLDTDTIELKTNLEFLPTDEKNLVYKAIKLIKDEYNIKTGVKAILTKNIPVEAGMAGGSTDCAAALLGMDKLFDLKIEEEKIMAYGKSLGADVPYCIMGATALSEGIGEILTKLPNAPQCYVVIAKPNVSVSTKYVYENLKLNELEKHPDIDKVVEAIKANDFYTMAKTIENVLESVTLKDYPIITEIKNKMIENGAINSLMSGSGPTVFGLYDDVEKAKKTVEEINKMQNIATCCITRFVY